ncbi:Uncharacterised protein [Mycobacterium tuberculosis]|nr:Uncharacterised protein [Mycobacterium tuberculosis]
MQQYREEDGQHPEQDKLEGEHPGDITLPEEGEAFRVLAIGLVTQHDIGDAAEEAHRADGDHDRGEPQA